MDSESSCCLGARLNWPKFPADVPIRLLGERVAINSQESTERAVFCLHDSHDLFLPRFFFFLPVHPLGMILILEFQFIDNHPPCQLIGRHFPAAAGSGLGKCHRSAQNDRRCNGGRAVYQFSQPMATSAHSTI